MTSDEKGHSIMAERPIDDIKLFPRWIPHFDKPQYEKMLKFLDKLRIDGINLNPDIRDDFISCIEEAYKLGKIDQARYDYINSKNR